MFTIEVTYCFRFRSAKEAEILEQKAHERGETLPSEARFDSNCITPGTEFMVRLHEQLKYFVTYKVSMDSQWQNVKVVLSGHEVGVSVVRCHSFSDFIMGFPHFNKFSRSCIP
jgi:5'-3' exoribonuclease 1